MYCSVQYSEMKLVNWKYRKWDAVATHLLKWGRRLPDAPSSRHRDRRRWTRRTWTRCRRGRVARARYAAPSPASCCRWGSANCKQWKNSALKYFNGWGDRSDKHAINRLNIAKTAFCSRHDTREGDWIQATLHWLRLDDFTLIQKLRQSFHMQACKNLA